jgi:hypothetical protein
VNPHDVPSQVATALAGTVHGVHEVPHAATLVFVTQLPAHAWKPALHAPIAQVPELQIGVPLATLHAFPHAPQCNTDTLMFVSQPSAGLPSQLRKPALHAPIAHVLALQVAAALANEHTLPHAPQFAALVRMSVSHPAMPGSQSPVLAGHIPIAQVPLEQIAPLPGQRLAHIPQFATLFERFVSQPFAASLSQLPKPVVHTPRPQTPALHTGAAFAAVHAVPHDPQFAPLL